ncbi:MAG TPA: DDE-type integrase/transposase/recombinase [Stellaceae bacterium]|nr:DDE-type integrase/transposase/recombinase [Stellaceae bacterium]
MLKIEPVIAHWLRRRGLCRATDGNLGELVVRIAGEWLWLWWAADHQGEVLDMLVQRPPQA